MEIFFFQQQVLVDSNLQVPTVFRSGSSGSCRHGSFRFRSLMWLFVDGERYPKFVKCIYYLYIIYIYISCLCILSFSFYVYFICILNLNAMKCSKRPPFVLGNVETKTKTIYYSYLPISMAPTRHAKQVPLLSRLRIMSSYLSRRNNSKNKLCNQTTTVDGSEIHPAPVGVYMFIPLSTRF